ncbi:2-succinyl-5-enolpyruvyl-6-hydroxy-3-cyclohexene-1-carboxylic-acid synthase [Bertholletia excelsa]
MSKFNLSPNEIPTPLSSFSLFQFPGRSSLPRASLLTEFNLTHLSLPRIGPLRRRLMTQLKVFSNPVQQGETSQTEEAELPFPICITRTLPPALTLEYGLQTIKEAIEELKSNSPPSSTAMFRFQVAVPPSAKALNWFCRQPASSGVFPQFFLSKEQDNPTFKSLLLGEVRGVFGIGAALLFKGTSCFSAEWNSLRRYLSVDSVHVKAYGFVDAAFDMDLSSMKRMSGSFYVFVPQIELDEFEDTSILAATLAWDNLTFFTFEDAIQSFELSLAQVTRHFWPTSDKCDYRYIKSALRKFSLVEDKSTQMVYMNALSMSGRNILTENMELRELSCSCQFSVRLSHDLAVSNNMLDHAGGMPSSLQHCPNINALWAYLIVEECCRLGLTYFCIAPGLRSSPLTIAASTHPHTTCIACFDERSLAFHAVGYARGSHKPAVVITSSGTAVSNLLPAVVEASQDFLPFLLLTADRPPELHDAGANQAIKQVDHFGPFVRFSFDLPAPTDDIAARMVLTTLDSAVYWATSSPYGPVHINCQFREPLDNSLRNWNFSCLKGLDFWMSSDQPFTKYIQLQNSYPSNGTHSQMAEVIEVIQGATRGILLVGAMHKEDEIWATLLLAKHLSWPVVADIFSGLRLRKHVTYFEHKNDVLFIDHMDHALLSDLTKGWVQADVIVQIGSRITSKRIAKMLEDSIPCSYIVVGNHPSRHDPSHIVTHRIQSSISQFSDCLLKAYMPQMSSKWCGLLQSVEKMGKRERETAGGVEVVVAGGYTRGDGGWLHERRRRAVYWGSVSFAVQANNGKKETMAAWQAGLPLLSADEGR